MHMWPEQVHDVVLKENIPIQSKKLNLSYFLAILITEFNLQFIIPKYHCEIVRKSTSAI